MASFTRFGSVLVEAGVIGVKDHDKYVALAAKRGMHIGEFLVENNIIDDQNVARTLSIHLGHPFVVLQQLRIPSYLAKLLNREQALRLSAIPVSVKTEGNQEVLYVAMFDPTDVAKIAEIEKITGRSVRVVVAGLNDIREAIARYMHAFKRPTRKSQEGGVTLAKVPTTEVPNLRNQDGTGAFPKRSSSTTQTMRIQGDTKVARSGKVHPLARSTMPEVKAVIQKKDSTGRHAFKETLKKATHPTTATLRRPTSLEQAAAPPLEPMKPSMPPMETTTTLKSLKKQRRESDSMELVSVAEFAMASDSTEADVRDVPRPTNRKSSVELETMRTAEYHGIRSDDLDEVGVELDAENAIPGPTPQMSVEPDPEPVRPASAPKPIEPSPAVDHRDIDLFNVDDMRSYDESVDLSNSEPSPFEPEPEKDVYEDLLDYGIVRFDADVPPDPRGVDDTQKTAITKEILEASRELGISDIPKDIRPAEKAAPKPETAKPEPPRPSERPEQASDDEFDLSDFDWKDEEDEVSPTAAPEPRPEPRSNIDETLLFQSPKAVAKRQTAPEPPPESPPKAAAEPKSGIDETLLFQSPKATAKREAAPEPQPESPPEPAMKPKSDIDEARLFQSSRSTANREAAPPPGEAPPDTEEEEFDLSDFEQDPATPSDWADSIKDFDTGKTRAMKAASALDEFEALFGEKPAKKTAADSTSRKDLIGSPDPTPPPAPSRSQIPEPESESEAASSSASPDLDRADDRGEPDWMEEMFKDIQTRKKTPRDLKREEEPKKSVKEEEDWELGIEKIMGEQQKKPGKKASVDYELAANELDKLLGNPSEEDMKHSETMMISRSAFKKMLESAEDPDAPPVEKDIKRYGRYLQQKKKARPDDEKIDKLMESLDRVTRKVTAKKKNDT